MGRRSDKTGVLSQGGDNIWQMLYNLEQTQQEQSSWGTVLKNQVQKSQARGKCT